MQANAIVEAAQGDSDVISLGNVLDPAMTCILLPCIDPFVRLITGIAGNILESMNLVLDIFDRHHLAALMQKRNEQDQQAIEYSTVFWIHWDHVV